MSAETGRSPRSLAVVVLAAGKGTRMKSGLAKVLHPLAGRPMLAYVLDAAEALRPERLVTVIGRDAEAVAEAFRGRTEFAIQGEQRGTGHAVLQAQPLLEGFRGEVLILYGDTPLLRAETLAALLALRADRDADLALISAPVDVPGIVLRDAEGRVARIVEATDASPDELAIRERNTGVYAVGSELLWKTLAQVDDRNAQGEIYLTGIVELAVRQGLRVEALGLDDAEEALGVNTRAELARAGAGLRRRVCERLMRDGVSIVDPQNTWIDWDVEVGMDGLIEPGCVIQGPTRIGERVHLKPGCVVESSRLGDDVVLGPNAHLRPGSVLGHGVRIGNFVEVKNSVLGDGVKADHLSYIGDADVGPEASFGCGAIVVNYDWNTKHRTRVGARARIGCNVNLVAPLEIADDAGVAAGSTITRDVPEGVLAVGRSREQSHVEGWMERHRRRKK
jgi:bifunctional UDP-N-acetylglucosamine pyrophosphorylase/glucosamine-1-phosphate N-acetyltransferase